MRKSLSAPAAPYPVEASAPAPAVPRMACPEWVTPKKAPRPTREARGTRRTGQGLLTTGKQVEVELGADTVDGSDDGVTGVVPAGAARADVGRRGEDVYELAFACSVHMGEQVLGIAVLVNGPSSPHWLPRTTRTPSRMGSDSRLLTDGGAGQRTARGVSSTCMRLASRCRGRAKVLTRGHRTRVNGASTERRPAARVSASN